jgi:glycosyltransferase 2 family protein
MEVSTETVHKKRRWLGLAIRILLTGAVFAYLFSRVDVRALSASLARIPALGLLGCFAASVAAFLLAVVRWRALLHAYGARATPPWRELVRWYLVSMFYNLLPGAVGGDVLRGYATRHYFSDAAAARSVGVVFVERVLGLTGLLILAALASTFGPLRDEQVLLYSVAGLFVAAAAIGSLAMGRRLARHLPARLARVVDSLPTLERPLSFAMAVCMAVVTHLLVSLAGHAVVASLDSRVRLGDSLVFFSIGTLAAYFPLTVAGAGTRDAALVLLFGRLGVSEADALACSLCLLFTNLLLAMFGSLLHSPGQLAVPGTKQAS